MQHQTVKKAMFRGNEVRGFAQKKWVASLWYTFLDSSKLIVHWY